MKKLFKYILRGLVILLGILVILYICIYAYVSANKKSIIADITTKIGKRLNGEVKIGDVDLSFISHFPRVSVVLTNVSVRDTQFATHRHAFFEAQKVYADLGFWRLIRKESSLTRLSIKNGGIYLFTDTGGYTNKYLLQLKQQDKSTSADSTADSELKIVDLENVRVVINDLKKGKLYDFQVEDLRSRITDGEGASMAFAVKNKILVHSLSFNTSKGSFIAEQPVEGDFDLQFDRKTKKLSFDSINMEIGKQPFNLSGSFDLDKKTVVKPQFSIRVYTKKINYEFAKSLLTEKIRKGVSIVSLSNTLDVQAAVSGPLGGGGEASVNVSWVTKDTDVKSKLASFDNCTFTGNFMNEAIAGRAKNDSNSKITIHDFRGDWRGLPIGANEIVVTNLPKPLLTCDLHTAFPLSTLNTVLNSSTISFDGGNASADLSYKGPIVKNTSDNSFLNGVIHLADGTVLYNPRGIALKNVNGDIRFRNSDVLLENLRCAVLNNNFVMNAGARNVLTLVNTGPNKVVLDWNIYTPSLNLAAFTALLKQPKKLVAKKNSTTTLQDWADKLDAVIEQGSISLKLKADNLIYKKFIATGVLADINVLQRSWILNKIALQHAGGNMQISGSLEDLKTNYHLAKIKVALEHVDVSKIFDAFNNFGQDGITSKSLRGKLSSDISVSVALNDEGTVYPAGIDGMVDFSLKEGALIDYEPVKKIQDVIFKKRDFANIQFAELKDKLEIKNQEVIINRMEIQSSVLSMFVEGKFSMKNTTDISIQVPLSNLKKRDKDYKPENAGVNTKAGMSVFLRGTPGPDGNVKFKYEMFHKFRKNE